jgi:hypothetical protein
LILEERKNLQTNYQFIQKLSLYFKQNVSFISSTNGLNCNSFQSNEIINQIINEDKNLNFDCRINSTFAYCSEGLKVDCEGRKAFCR